MTPFRYTILAIFLSFPLISFSQSNDVPFKTETGGGINFNTNGGIIGGVMAKRSVYIKKNMFHYMGLEFVNVKHPKEQRTSSQVTGNSYIYYKQNYLFSIRTMYGREFLLFHKSEEEGVRVSGILAGGLTFGLEKPYAINYDYTNYNLHPGSPPLDTRNEPFNPAIHNEQNRILGTGGAFTAFGKTKVVPGLNIKGALAFEFGSSTTGVEIGGLLEMFPRKIILIPGANNSSVFTSIFINIYYASRD